MILFLSLSNTVHPRTKCRNSIAHQFCIVTFLKAVGLVCNVLFIGVNDIKGEKKVCHHVLAPLESVLHQKLKCHSIELEVLNDDLFLLFWKISFCFRFNGNFRISARFEPWKEMIKDDSQSKIELFWSSKNRSN